MRVEVILSPAELPPLRQRDLHDAACVVFDILRATSTFVTALHHGANAIVPVSEISEALALRATRQEVLLAGERDGLRIRAAQTGGVDFDLGNSPREFTPDRVRGKTIVSTTTNGTRALRACGGAATVLAGSFLNLTVTAQFVRKLDPAQTLLVCAGTREFAALEDVLAAGAFCEILEASQPGREHAAGRIAAAPLHWSDSAEIARRAYAQSKPDLLAAARTSENAQRLLAIPDLREDVPFCLQRDVCAVVAQMDAAGKIRAH